MTATYLAPTPAPQSLPTCPDGSGDLWWDDASYVRYQSWDPQEEPTHLDFLAATLPSQGVEGWVAQPLELVTVDYCASDTLMFCQAYSDGQQHQHRVTVDPWGDPTLVDPPF